MIVVECLTCADLDVVDKTSELVKDYDSLLIPLALYKTPEV